MKRFCPALIAAQPGPCPRSRGFSLLELLVVMLIIGISSGVFLGYNYRQRDSVTLRSTANEMQRFFRMARGHALLEARDNTCEYDAENHLVHETLRGREMTLPGIVTLSLDMEGSLDASMPLAFFFADGSAEHRRIVLEAAEQRIVLSVDPVLGEIHLER